MVLTNISSPSLFHCNLYVAKFLFCWLVLLEKNILFCLFALLFMKVWNARLCLRDSEPNRRRTRQRAVTRWDLSMYINSVLHLKEEFWAHSAHIFAANRRVQPPRQRRRSCRRAESWRRRWERGRQRWRRLRPPVCWRPQETPFPPEERVCDKSAPHHPAAPRRQIQTTSLRYTHLLLTFPEWSPAC